MSVVDGFTTYNTWVICAKTILFILACPRSLVFFCCILFGFQDFDLCLVGFVEGDGLYGYGQVLPVSLVVGMVIFVPLWLTTMIRSRLNHIYTSLVGWLGWCSKLWCRRLVVWEGLKFWGMLTCKPMPQRCKSHREPTWVNCRTLTIITSVRDPLHIRL